MNDTCRLFMRTAIWWSSGPLKSPDQDAPRQGPVELGLRGGLWVIGRPLAFWTPLAWRFVLAASRPLARAKVFRPWGRCRDAEVFLFPGRQTARSVHHVTNWPRDNVFAMWATNS